MQSGGTKKNNGLNIFRQQHMTSWPRSHPVVLPHLHTGHWSVMKTMVPTCYGLVPTAMLKNEDFRVLDSDVAAHTSNYSLLPPLTLQKAETAFNDSLPEQGASLSYPKNTLSPQNKPQYRNEYNERARRGFCYWLLENKPPKCHRSSIGSYKTSLGLPRV